MAIAVMSWVWDNSRSHGAARLVLLAIADSCNDSDGTGAWPSNRKIQRKANLSERGVRDAVTALVALGELEVEYNAGRGGSNLYRVTMPDYTDVPPAPKKKRKAKTTTEQDDPTGGHEDTTDPSALGSEWGDGYQLPDEDDGVIEAELVDDGPEATTAPPARPDVEALCQLLADRIAANLEGSGSKKRRPSVTKSWRDAARLMIDKDGREPAAIAGAIEWSQNHRFWRTNVLSMPTLRDQYDRMWLQAQAEKNSRPGRPAAASARADEAEAAGIDTPEKMREALGV
jgi:hypothetical protein